MKLLVGVDEAGRGCWAGPLVASAVMLKSPIDGLNDSKKLTADKRHMLNKIIHKQATVGIGWVSAKEIDDIGLTLATQKAIKEAMAYIKLAYDEVIIDGNFNYLKNYKKVRVIPKADMTVPCVSAASIVAKVARDQYMVEAAEQFPEYGFERHVGYGTAEHMQMLQKHGPCGLHRMSYKPIQNLARLYGH